MVRLTRYTLSTPWSVVVESAERPSFEVMESGFMLSCGALVRAGARAGSVQQAWEEPPARGGARQRQHHTSTASRVWVNELSRIMFRYRTLRVTEYRGHRCTHTVTAAVTG